MLTARYYHSLFLILALIIVNGCSKQDNVMQEYSQRLSNVLETHYELSEHTYINKPPVLRFEDTNKTISLLAFLKLNTCSLQKVIAHKNSSLGKQAPPSQQLMNDLAFLKAAPACIDTLIHKQQYDLAAQLQENIDHKQKQLSQRIWYATLGAKELQAFWSPKIPATYPDNTNNGPIEALNYLSHQSALWLSGEYDFDSSKIEQALFDLKQGDGGSLLQSWLNIEQGLHNANTQIKQRLGNKPLCHKGKGEQQFQYANNIVNRYFINNIQKHAAKLSKRQYTLFSAIRRLETSLIHAEPEHYTVWKQQRNAMLIQALDAPKNHTFIIKQLWQQCNYSH